jgi:tetrahydromethanopterin S-methyltransferase subunit G
MPIGSDKRLDELERRVERLEGKISALSGRAKLGDVAELRNRLDGLIAKLVPSLNMPDLDDRQR